MRLLYSIGSRPAKAKKECSNLRCDLSRLAPAIPQPPRASDSATLEHPRTYHTVPSSSADPHPYSQWVSHAYPNWQLDVHPWECVVGYYGKGGREQVECGHMNGVSRYIVCLTCAKARLHMAIRRPVAEANIKTSVGVTTAFMPCCKQH